MALNFGKVDQKGRRFAWVGGTAYIARPKGGNPRSDEFEACVSVPGTPLESLAVCESMSRAMQICAETHKARGR